MPLTHYAKTNSMESGISSRLQRKLTYSFLILAFCVSVTDFVRLMRAPEVAQATFHTAHRARKF